MARFLKCVLIFLLWLTIVSCNKSTPTYTPPPYVPPSNTTFTNPILSNGPDPWVIQKDSFYYYTQTSGNKIQLWKTKNMSQLNSAKAVTIWTKPAAGPTSENVWAPELHYLDNKWYIYFTAGSGNVNTSQRLFVLENSSTDPTTGTWVDKGQIKDAANDFWAIDATVFEYNGNNYIAWSGHRNVDDWTEKIYISSLQNPWTLASGRVEISSPTYEWEKYGSPPAVNEAPEVIKNPAGKPVLVFSASGCWTDDYSMGVLLLKDGGNVLNASDWVKSANPVFVKKPDNGAYAPGHCAFFKSPDGTEDWIIYHANSFANQGCGDVRNPRMQKFSWNADGSPHLGEPVKINIPITKPSGETQ
jgi:GH43 family beta-xylosidase